MGVQVGITNKKDTTSMYIGEANAASVVAADKLVNLASIGELGGSVDEIEDAWLDTGKVKFPDEAKYDSIEVEQNILTAEVTKLMGYFQNGTYFPFACFVHNKSGEVIFGVKQTGFLSAFHQTGNQIGEVVKVKYSISPSGPLELTTTEPAAAAGTGD